MTAITYFYLQTRNYFFQTIIHRPLRAHSSQFMLLERQPLLKYLYKNEFNKRGSWRLALIYYLHGKL